MTNLELKRHNDFLLTHNDIVRRKIIQTIYRGDSLKNLCEKLNVEFNDSDVDLYTLLDRLFMVGEKGKRFYTDNENFRIDESENYVFDRIFKYYNDSLKSKNTNTIFFFDRNIALKEFFTNKENKIIFINKINGATQSERVNIRNYYLIMLHQLAVINYKNKSHFVSTSKDYKIAEKFANGKREKNKIILHCWIPIKRNREIISKYNLPTYNFHPYQYQREYSILGGILPHFISGIELFESRDFYPNPNIFIQDISTSTFLNGLNINQTHFHEIANLTNYKRTLSTDGNDTWEN